MTREQAIASNVHHLLREEFSGTGVIVTPEGEGVHWHVDAVRGSRSCRIHCFHYDTADTSLHLGIRGNAHLSKVNVGPRHQPRQGPEYFIEFRSESDIRATGRTQDASLTQAAVRDWVAGALALDQLYALHAFVDSRRRKLHEAMGVINDHFSGAGSVNRAELDGEGQEDCELWVYAAERSCQIAAGSGARVGVAFLLHRTQLAAVEDISVEDAARTVARWVDEKVETALLHSTLPALSVDINASDFERGDHSVWHWANVVRRAADDDSVLSAHRPIIDGVVARKSLSRFFSFTSHYRLCFSRSSLYPFDNAGLPVVVPLQAASGGTTYGVCMDEQPPKIVGPPDRVLDALEQLVAAETRSPYFGSIDDLLPDRMNRELVAKGSRLRARKVQRRQWLEVRVASEDGRWCRLHLHALAPKEEVSVDFTEPTGQPGRDQRVTGTIGQIADAVIAWAAAR